MICMNVLSLIDSELKDKHLSEFEKVRYIYLRTCELFYFDTRYRFKEYLSKRKVSKIINKIIDLEDVDDFGVICHTYSEFVLKRLINEFTNMDVELKSGGHSYLILKDNEGNSWNLDATLGDLSRVKIGTKTTGFNCVSDGFCLDDIDRYLGYEFMNKSFFISNINMSSFDNMIKDINNLINSNDKLNNFSDISFFVKWLILDVIHSYTTAIDRKYNFYSFYLNFFDELFYLSNNDSCNIKKISKDDGRKLIKRLHSLDDTFIKKL